MTKGLATALDEAMSQSNPMGAALLYRFERAGPTYESTPVHRMIAHAPHSLARLISLFNEEGPLLKFSQVIMWSLFYSPLTADARSS